MSLGSTTSDLDRITAGFVLQGTTLTAWCRQEGVHRPNLIKAIKGEWKGPTAAALVNRVAECSAKGFAA